MQLLSPLIHTATINATTTTFTVLITSPEVLLFHLLLGKKLQRQVAQDFLWTRYLPIIEAL